MLHGQCHCGQVQYEMPEEVAHHALCHCTDCRRCSGAPAVAWALAPRDKVTITGNLKSYRSSEHAVRQFCPECGTGLFYLNEQIFPGMVDVQSATLDDPGGMPIQAQIQTAERIGWMEDVHELPGFERYPG